MQQYKCKHFRRVVTGIWCQLGNCRADLGVVTRQFYCISQQKSVPQMCHCNAVSVSLFLPLSLRVPICLSACRTVWAVTFFLLLGHPHSVAYCNIAYIRCVRCVFVCMFKLVCKPLENCIFISIVYLLRHLFAFDLPCSTRGNCSNHRTTITAATTASWAADKFF